MRHVPLTVVHVAASLTVAASTLAWPAGRVPEEVLEIQENEARRVIADAIKVAEDSAEGSDRPEINSELFFGGPVPTLVDLSKEAQMVVVGCRGRTGRHRRLLGSVSTGLIHHAHCPVAVIHDEAPSSLQSAQLPVLVGIDGSRASELATAIAFDEASWRGVDLVALHVWGDADMSTVIGMESSALQSAADKTLAESLAGWQERYPEVTVHRLVEFEHPARPSSRPVREGSARCRRQPWPGRIRRHAARFGQHRRGAGGPRTGEIGKTFMPPALPEASRLGVMPSIVRLASVFDWKASAKSARPGA